MKIYLKCLLSNYEREKENLKNHVFESFVKQKKLTILVTLQKPIL